MRLPYLLVPILAGVVAGCREEVTAPDTPEPPTAVPVQQRGAPAQSGVVVRFTNAEFGVTFTWNWYADEQLLVHHSIHNGLEGFPDSNFEIEECIAPTAESGEWTFTQVATPSGDIHDRDGSREFHTRVFDGTGAPVDPVFGFPVPSCEFMTAENLLAEGTSSVWWTDNDYFGIGGPGANSFGRVVHGKLVGPSGEAITLRELSRLLIRGDEFTIVKEAIGFSPDPRD